MLRGWKPKNGGGSWEKWWLNVNKWGFYGFSWNFTGIDPVVKWHSYEQASLGR
jgi:hypothetical protein